MLKKYRDKKTGLIIQTDTTALKCNSEWRQFLTQYQLINDKDNVSTKIVRKKFNSLIDYIQYLNVNVLLPQGIERELNIDYYCGRLQQMYQNMKYYIKREYLMQSLLNDDCLDYDTIIKSQLITKMIEKYSRDKNINTKQQFMGCRLSIYDVYNNLIKNRYILIKDHIAETFDRTVIGVKAGTVIQVCNCIKEQVKCCPSGSFTMLHLVCKIDNSDMIVKMNVDDKHMLVKYTKGNYNKVLQIIDHRKQQVEMVNDLPVVDLFK